MISVAHLEYRYPRAASPTLRDVTFDIPPGASAAIVGPSGCGKSTLLSLLAGLLPVSRGQVRVAGLDLHGMSEADRDDLRARRIAFVFQRAMLLPFLSVADNLRVSAELAGRRTSMADALEALEWVELPALAHRMPAALSVGEAQRVAVARALIRRPEVLLADEPTGALDRAATGTVLSLLLTRKQASSTVVVATHDPWVARQCDATLSLEDGVLR